MIRIFKSHCVNSSELVLYTAWKSNQSILKETNPEYSLEGLMIKLKLQQAGHLHRVNSLEKTLMLGKREEKEKGTAQDVVRQHHQLNGHEFKKTSRDSGGKKGVACYNPWSHKQLDTTQQLNNNNELMFLGNHHFGLQTQKDMSFD